MVLALPVWVPTDPFVVAGPFTVAEPSFESLIGGPLVTAGLVAGFDVLLRADGALITLVSPRVDTAATPTAKKVIERTFLARWSGLIAIARNLSSRSCNY